MWNYKNSLLADFIYKKVKFNSLEANPGNEQRNKNGVKFTVQPLVLIQSSSLVLQTRPITDYYGKQCFKIPSIFQELASSW